MFNKDAITLPKYHFNILLEKKCVYMSDHPGTKTLKMHLNQEKKLDLLHSDTVVLREHKGIRNI